MADAFRIESKPIYTQVKQSPVSLLTKYLF